MIFILRRIITLIFTLTPSKELLKILENPSFLGSKGAKHNGISLYLIPTVKCKILRVD